MRHPWPGVLAAMAGAVLWGCASPLEVDRLRAQAQETNLRLLGLRRDVDRIDSLVRAQSGQVRDRWLESSARQQGSLDAARQTRAQLDEVARRLAALAEGVETMGVYGGGAVPALAPEAERELYDLAFDHLATRDYPLAARQFEDLLQRFPASDLADNAGYWLGECHYARGDYALAAATFERVAADYPEGDKAPAALLKLGYSLAADDRDDQGMERLRELLRRFPETAEAELARQRLRLAEGESPPPRGPR